MPESLDPGAVALALLALNLVTFFAFGIDKRKAEVKARRISESTLLWLAFLGGSPGAYAGRSVFRHKTRKQPFCRHLHMILMLQALALGGALAWLVAG